MCYWFFQSVIESRAFDIFFVAHGVLSLLERLASVSCSGVSSLSALEISLSVSSSEFWACLAVATFPPVTLSNRLYCRQLFRRHLFSPLFFYSGFLLAMTLNNLLMIKCLGLAAMNLAYTSRSAVRTLAVSSQPKPLQLHNSGIDLKIPLFD